jgi:hypothetical protein
MFPSVHPFRSETPLIWAASAISNSLFSTPFNTTNRFCSLLLNVSILSIPSILTFSPNN